MAGMIEVFVAQFNGSGHWRFIGGAVWQMIWFSLFTGLIFIPVGLFLNTMFYLPHSLEAEYFKWIMCFGALQPFSCALTTFFVGRGRIKWVVVLTLFAMLLNIILDQLLIFGTDFWIPALGVKGAVIASCTSLSFQSIVLMIFFLRKHNRKEFGTNNWKFNLKDFWKFCRITAPPAVLYNMELIGWSVFYFLMTNAGHMHITVASICQSLILLFSFIGDGLCRGVSVIVNNLVGSGKNKLVQNVLKSSFYALLTIFVLQAIALSIKPNIFIKTYLSDYAELQLFSSSLETCLFFVLIFLLFQGIQWTVAGILYAYGETLFVMTAGTFAMWACLILPEYFLVVKKGFSPHFAWGIVVLYSLSTTLLYFWKLRQCTRQPVSVTGKIHQLIAVFPQISVQHFTAAQTERQTNVKTAQ